MLLITVCVLLSVVNGAFVPVNDMTQTSFRSLPDFDALRAEQRAKGIQEAMWTIHTKDIMGAISRGERNVHINMKKDEIDMSLWNAEDPKPFYSQLLHTTVVDYNLKGEEDGVKKFMSLDEAHHASSIRSIDSDGIVHCAATMHHLEEGDVILASEHGSDVHFSASSQSSLGSFMRSLLFRETRDSD